MLISFCFGHNLLHHNSIASIMAKAYVGQRFNTYYRYLHIHNVNTNVSELIMSGIWNIQTKIVHLEICPWTCSSKGLVIWRPEGNLMVFKYSSSLFRFQIVITDLFGNLSHNELNRQKSHFTTFKRYIGCLGTFSHNMRKLLPLKKIVEYSKGQVLSNVKETRKHRKSSLKIINVF